MKKKIWIAILGIGFLLTVFLCWYNVRYVKVFEDLDANTISKVDIWNKNVAISVQEKKDIEDFASVLQSMKLNKTFSNVKEGDVFFIEIYCNDETKMELVVRGDVIVVDETFYKTKSNYCDAIWEIYNRYSEE